MQCSAEQGDAASPPPGGGIYVHVPFCRTICPYCDFAVVADREPSRHDDWARAVQRSLAAEPARLRAETVYVGGGTPGRLDDRAIAGLLAAVRERCGDGWREVTVEANPEDLDADRLARWRAAGVDRLSVGVQRLTPARLKMLGRARSSPHLTRLPTLLGEWRAAGGRSSIDLIYGLPGEDPAAFRAEVAAVLGWPVDHLSAYALTVEPRTPWARATARGRLLPADDETTAACYAGMLDELSAHGWDAYEVSNFAADGARALHNSGYWQGRPWLGFGPDAASSLPDAGGTLRFRRRRGWDEWLADPVGRCELEVVDAEAAVAERLALGLRSFVGVPQAWLEPWRRTEPDLVARLLGEGDLVAGEQPGTLVLRPSARLLADEWALRWWAALDAAGEPG